VASLGNLPRDTHMVKATSWLSTEAAIQLASLLGKVGNPATLKPSAGGPRWRDSWLFTESGLYTMSAGD